MAIQDNNLPEGWVETTLDQVLSQFESGSRPKGGVRGIPDGIPSIGGEHLNENGGFRFDKIKYIPRSFYKKMSKGIVSVDDILIVKDGATTGKVALVKDDFPFDIATVNEHVFICRPADGVESSFLFYFLFSEEGQKRILENFRGSVQGGINLSFAPGTNILLAPTPEQKRIAAKIDELLTRVNAVRERLAKIPGILKRFRQAVLTAAFTGELTEDWRECREIQESGEDFLRNICILKGKLKIDKFGKSDNLLSGNLPQNWTSSAFGYITNNYDGKRIPIKADDRMKRIGEYPYYGASGIIDHINDYIFDGKYLLIGEDGANLLMRSTPIAFIATGQFWVNNHAHIIQTLGGMPLKYLEIYINSIDLQDYVTGSAQPKLTQANMNRIPVPIPPLSEQLEIVNRVGALFKLADSIENHLMPITNKANNLAQSILAKAFRGELVPTEAELARREGRDYEPAAELLERIKKDSINRTKTPKPKAI